MSTKILLKWTSKNVWDWLRAKKFKKMTCAGSRILVILPLLIPLKIGFAQEELLKFSPGARAVAIGKTGVVGVYDPSAAFWNPAILGAFNSNMATFSIHEPFSANLAGYSHFFPMYGSVAIYMGKTYFASRQLQLGGMGYGFRFGRHFHTGFSIGISQIGRESWATGGAGLLFKPTKYPDFGAGDDDFFSSSLIADRLEIGVAAQPIPLIVSGYDNQFRMGFSYAVPEIGSKIIFASHLNSEKDSYHLGLALSPLEKLEILAGWKDFRMKEMGAGLQLALDNFQLGLTYDNALEKISFTAIFRIGAKPSSIAQQEYTKAKKFLQNQNTRQAYSQSQRSLAFDPQNKDATLLIAKLQPILDRQDQAIDSLLFEAKKFERQKWFISAAANYLKILKMNPENSKASSGIEIIRPKVNINVERWYQNAVRYFDQEDYKRAKEIFESILIVRDDHVGSKSYLEKINVIFRKIAEQHYYAGLGYYSQRNLNRAEEEFQKALEYVPNHAEAQNYLEKTNEDRSENANRIDTLLAQASDQERQGYLKPALDRYEEVLLLGADNEIAKEKARVLRSRIDAIAEKQFALGQQALEAGNLQAAKNALKTVISLKPNHAGAQTLMAKINRSMNGRLQELYDVASVQYENGNWDGALSTLDSILLINPNFGEAKILQENTISKMGVEKLVEKAKSLYLSGQYLQALELFNEALIKDTDNMDAAELREQCQSRLSEQAEEYFTRGIQLYTEEKYQSAISEWDKVLQINPYHTGAQEYKKRAEERIEALNRLPANKK